MDNRLDMTYWKFWRLLVLLLAGMFTGESFGQAPAPKPPPALAPTPTAAPTPPAAPATARDITLPLKNPAAEALRAEGVSGNAVAQFKLGMLFAAGKEVPQDLGMAAAWLRKSAEQGNAAAQFNLAVFYSQ